MRRIITAVAIVAVLAGGGAILGNEPVDPYAILDQNNWSHAVAGVPVDEF
jgi:hypothetical protein